MTEQPTMRDIVDVVFAQLRLTFGVQWDRMWSDGVELQDGRDRGVELTKEHWSRELAIYDDQRYRLRYALGEVKRWSKPPNLGDFRSLCGQAPRSAAPPALPKPRAEPNPRVIEALVKAISGPKPDPLAWARRPKSVYAMNLIVSGARAGDKVLCEILRGHCRQGHPHLTHAAQAWYASQNAQEVSP